MALSLKDKETDRLAREVAALTDESLTDAVRQALPAPRCGAVRWTRINLDVRAPGRPLPTQEALSLRR
jgi:hypothetical protein